jgi:hypothetical protein
MNEYWSFIREIPTTTPKQNSSFKEFLKEGGEGQLTWKEEN